MTEEQIMGLLYQRGPKVVSTYVEETSISSKEGQLVGHYFYSYFFVAGAVTNGSTIISMHGNLDGFHS